MGAAFGNNYLAIFLREKWYERTGSPTCSVMVEHVKQGTTHNARRSFLNGKDDTA